MDSKAGGSSFFKEASVPGISPRPNHPKHVSLKPFNEIDNSRHIDQIVNHKGSIDKGCTVRGLPKHLLASHKVELLTVDSGACDSMAPPSMFKNTPTIKHKEFGNTYKACGGEQVTNIGLKKRSMHDWGW